ncbi:MAG: MFS transporter [Sedimenticola sp.]
MQGFYEAIFGPALIDLKSVFGASYSSVSWAVGSRGIGIPVGGVIGGILADKFPKWLDTMLALSTVLTAVTIAWAPYSGTINVLWLMCFLNGFGLCTTNIGMHVRTSCAGSIVNLTF